MKSAILSLLGAAVLGAMNVSAQTLTGIESVEYDSVNNRYLISNKTNIIAQSATNGAWSFLGQGATSQYGMEIVKNVLYTLTGTVGVKGYDLTTGSEVFSVPLAGSQMLNGITGDGDSLIWITDTFGKSITQVNVTSKQFKKIVTAFSGQPNGIYFDKSKNRLVFINWGNNVQVNTVDLTNNTVASAKTTDRGNCDGITRDRAGNWYISCWLPQPGVFKIAPDFSGSLTAVPGTFSNPADMDYNHTADIIAVPNTTGNTVALVQLNNPVSLHSPAFSTKAKPQGVFWWNAGGMVMFDVNNPNGSGLYNIRGRSVHSDYRSGR
jgi:hypothetical protein